MIEPEFALLEMQVESMTWDTVEFGEPSLRVTPEGLDPIDVVVVDTELVQVMANAKMLGVPYVDQAVVARPSVAVDDGFQTDASPDHLLQRGFAAVGNDLGIDTVLSLKDPENDGLTSSTTTMLATNSTGAEIGFVHFNGSTERRLRLADFREPLPDAKEKVVHGTNAHACHPCGLTRGEIFVETPQNKSKTTLGNLRNFVIAVNSFHCRSIHPLGKASAS
jgi:hypothetical protein